MRNQNSKIRVTKRKLSKCKEVCRTFTPLQYAFADILEQNPEVAEFQCNVPLVGLEIEGTYTTDFVITKEQLFLTLLPRAKATFTRKGLICKKFRYHADGFTEQYLNGGDGIVAFNPDDTSQKAVCLKTLR